MADAYDPSRYARVVGDYDALYPGEPDQTAAAVDLLADLAVDSGTSSIVEMGVGTGRLAIPLRARGLAVHGIDGSAAMGDALHAKPGGDIDVTIGDYRTARAGSGEFGVALLVANGIFDPRGLDAQLDIFANAAAHLVPGGFFVVESWVMSAEEQNGEWSLMPRFVGHDHVELQLARYDIDTNRIERTLVHIRSGPPAFVTVTDIYASPGQLDVIAHVSGFAKHGRWQDWCRARFTSTSRNHVTAYRKIAAPPAP